MEATRLKLNFSICFGKIDIKAQIDKRRLTGLKYEK
jgi:hypothetical protein